MLQQAADVEEPQQTTTSLWFLPVPVGVTASSQTQCFDVYVTSKPSTLGSYLVFPDGICKHLTSARSPFWQLAEPPAAAGTQTATGGKRHVQRSPRGRIRTSGRRPAEVQTD